MNVEFLNSLRLSSVLFVTRSQTQGWISVISISLSVVLQVEIKNILDTSSAIA